MEKTFTLTLTEAEISDIKMSLLMANCDWLRKAERVTGPRHATLMRLSEANGALWDKLHAAIGGTPIKRAA